MHYSALQAVLLTGLLESASAVPQYQYAGYQPKSRCGDHYLEKYENVKVKEQYFEPWKMASGINCHSNNDAPCTLQKAFFYSKTTTFSLGFQLQAKAKLTPIWEIAPTISVGYSWATTKGESSSSNQPCAKGAGIVCGLQYRPKIVKLTGTYYKIEDKTYGDCSDKRFDEKPFEIESAVILGEKSEEKGDEAYVEYEACISACDNQDACWKAHESGTPVCPGVTIKDWGKKPESGGGGGGGGGGGNTNGSKKGCDKEPGEQKGQCKPEHIGRWNCVKGESWQRCASGTWSGLTPLPAGAFCDCGYKGRDWDPANPGTNPPV